MFLAISGFQYLFFKSSGSFPEGGGGLLAAAGVNALSARFATLGTALILLLIFGIGAVVAVDKLIVMIPLAILRTLGIIRKVPLGKAASGTKGTLGSLFKRREKTADSPAKPSKISAKAIPVRMHGKQSATDHIDSDAGGRAAVKSFDPDNESESQDESKSTGQIDMDALREKVMKLPINFAAKKLAESSDEEAEIIRPVDYSDYKFPGIDLLAEPEATYSEKLEEYVREQAIALESALQTYRIDGKVVEIDSGPVITLYEVQLVPGTKVAAITSIQSDIARALKAPNIRIVPNMAGKTTVGIEVPNLNKECVRVKELMTAAPQAAKMNLPMFLAKDASGTPLVADLSAMPHMLIAGTTGSGKSVCINSILISFLYTKRPDELKLILVDPKMVEMAQFKKIPHLMCPVVTETPKAAAILEWAVNKMEERYELLAEVGVRDIASYNKLGWDEISHRIDPASDEEAARIPKKLPYIVFVVDELADLIMTCKEAETSIVRIAQKARAVGIHLILATQRPQANVVTGLIKSNMPCRISFKVSSGMDSRIVLDQKGAELLLGMGDMLFLGPHTSELVRAQGSLVDDPEIRRVVRFLMEVAEPSFERQLMTIRSVDQGDGEDAGEVDTNERDPLFNDAVDIIVQSKRGSVSLLQRRLAIGYTRASRLIDQMGHAGIIGEHKGTVAREVVVTPEEWSEMRRMMEAEEAEETLFAKPEDESKPDAGSTDDSRTGGPSTGAGQSKVGTSGVDPSPTADSDQPIELQPQPGELPILDVEETEESAEYDEVEDSDSASEDEETEPVDEDDDVEYEYVYEDGEDDGEEDEEEDEDDEYEYIAEEDEEDQQ